MMDLREKYDELFIEQALLLQEKRTKKIELTNIKKQIKICTVSRFLLVEVSRAIQKQFKLSSNPPSEEKKQLQIPL